MTDDNDSLLAELDLHAWRVPPPTPIDRAALVGTALSPALQPPRAMRLRWIVAALVIVNALVTAMIVIATRAPAAPAIVMPAGGPADDQIAGLAKRVAELEAKLGDVDALRARVQELSHADDRTPTRPLPTLVERVAPTSTGPDSIDRDAIKNAIGPVKSEIAACGQRAGFKGMVKVRARVSPDGSVAASSNDAVDAELNRCIKTIIDGLAFPKTQQGGAFSYPFIF